MNNKKTYEAFMEAVCKKFGCVDAIPALKKGFTAYCEAVSQYEDPGESDFNSDIEKFNAKLDKYKDKYGDLIGKDHEAFKHVVPFKRYGGRIDAPENPDPRDYFQTKGTYNFEKKPDGFNNLSKDARHLLRSDRARFGVNGIAEIIQRIPNVSRDQVDFIRSMMLMRNVSLGCAIQFCIDHPDLVDAYENPKSGGQEGFIEWDAVQRRIEQQVADECGQGGESLESGENVYMDD
jgi:hypothetical protein